MTSSLRMRVVEAGARALWRKEYGRDATIDDSEFDRYTVPEVAAVLDAMLDCLTENLDDRDRWVDVSASLREDR